MEPVLTDNARTVLSKRYFIKNEAGEVVETPRDFFDRVARAIAKADEQYGETRGQAYPVFYTMMASGDFEPNTPCLANAGRPQGHGQLSACFVLPIEDSMESIFETLKSTALIHQSGGGTGFSFSRLRPRGDFVRSTTGIASGPISFMKAYNGTTEVVKQSGIRRGANMGILRCDHPDILAFIDCKQDTREVTNFNISVAITDRFMAALRAGEDYDLVNPRTKEVVSRLSAKTVWEKIVANAWRTGEPGLFFVDRVNALDPLSNHLGLVEATNPCVPGDTRILTRGGWLKIRDAVGKRVDVWNGENWSTVEPAVTGVNQPLVRVTLSDGCSLRCTPAHRFHLADGVTVPAKDLLPGDALERLGFTPPTEGSEAFASDDEAYLHGFYQGDGYVNSEKGQCEINFYGEGKRVIAAWLAARGLVRLQPWSESQNRQRGVINDGTSRSFEKGQVPDLGVRQALAWLAGLMDADGNIVANGSTSYGYQISSIDRAFLGEVQMLLRRLGVPSTLALMKDAQIKEMPGGEYLCQPCWRISIAASAARRLQDAGLRPRRLPWHGNEPARMALRFPRVVSVEPAGVADKVYCFTEPQRHRGVFDGVLTGQCGEVPLRAYDACTLGSINLSRFYSPERGGTINFSRLSSTIQSAVHFLDNVLTVNRYPLPQIHEMTAKCRKIGLGVMGWADLLVKLGIPYASDDALQLGEQVMQFINAEAVQASEVLAEVRGPFPEWGQSRWAARGDKPRRNATVTVIAPTGSISIIAGCSSGIEPLFAVAFERNQAEARMMDVHPEFVRVAQREGFYSEELIRRVAERGTLSGMGEVPQKYQRLFQTSMDIDAEWHVRMQAVFQKHTEDAVSKTINLRRDAPPEQVAKAYMLAWDLGCKGITVYRDGSREEQVLSVGTTKKEVEPPRDARRRIPDNGRRDGTTITKKTVYGNVHCTINRHPVDDEPYELFAEMGKSGDEVKALTEALGRVASLFLSIDSSVPPKTRLDWMAEQFAHIGGGGQVGFGAARIVSVPDGIAHAITDYLYGANPQTKKPELRRDICPDCKQPTLDKGGGCDVCSNCGHSRC